MNLKTQNIVFFDGHCVLCNGFVDFLISRDKRSRLKFASLQGDTAKKLLPGQYLSKMESVVFLDLKNTIYVKSTAILWILKSIGGIWKLGVIFFVFPQFMRDFFYNFIARNRYSWFGRNDACRLPSEEEREKILP